MAQDHIAIMWLQRTAHIMRRVKDVMLHWCFRLPVWSPDIKPNVDEATKVASSQSSQHTAHTHKHILKWTKRRHIYIGGAIPVRWDLMIFNWQCSWFAWGIWHQQLYVEHTFCCILTYVGMDQRSVKWSQCIGQWESTDFNVPNSR